MYYKEEEGGWAEKALVETYDVDKLRLDFARSPARKANAELLIASLESAGTPRGRGVTQKDEGIEAKRAASLTAMEKMVASFEHVGDNPAAGSAEALAAADETPKRRRLQKKTTPTGMDQTQEVTYVTPQHGRGRRIAQKDAAQGMDQRLQKVLLDDTLDIDMRNCVFVLVSQMVKRVGVYESDGYIRLLDELSSDRKVFCEKKLGMSEVH